LHWQPYQSQFRALGGGGEFSKYASTSVSNIQFTKMSYCRISGNDPTNFDAAIAHSGKFVLSLQKKLKIKKKIKKKKKKGLRE